MSDYIPTIGLEIHAELKTKTKMFCNSTNDANEAEPNVHVCPVCMAHPGTLPVINAEAVKSVLRVGVAVGASLADYTEFDRKNYFYPDLPKGYQLSQFEYPLVAGGELKNVAITRIHLEEDTASSMHDESAGVTSIDYNRAGVPLMELVTEPVITSAEQAGEFARELQLLLRYLGVSNANMEMGEMRVEANISVGKDGVLGTKVEVKNLNSFNTMERAVRYEIKRQEELLNSGGVVVQETRGWNDSKQSTFSQRSKEGSADYRYFPDPDLPSLRLSELEGFDVDSLRATLPELPSVRRARYEAISIKPDDIELYVKERIYGDFFDEVVKEFDTARVALASNYIGNDLVKIIRDMQKRDSVLIDTMPISVAFFRELIDLVAEKKISSRSAKDLLVLCISENASPSLLAEQHGMLSTNDAGLISGVIEAVIAENPNVVAEIKGGKVSAMEFLVGRSMKALKGAGEPVSLRAEIAKKLGL